MSMGVSSGCNLIVQKLRLKVNVQSIVGGEITLKSSTEKIDPVENLID
jgi:hypothetical protein